jgi:hypothetical protein
VVEEGAAYALRRRFPWRMQRTKRVARPAGQGAETGRADTVPMDPSAPSVLFDLAHSYGSARYAFVFAAAIAALALAMVIWSRWRRSPVSVLALWCGGVALVCGGAGLAQAAERHELISAPGVLQAEGPVEQLWDQSVPSRSDRKRSWQWQGFTLGEVEFAYVRNAEQNCFHNGSEHAVALREGDRLRVHYVERPAGAEPATRAERCILRVERLPS